MNELKTRIYDETSGLDYVLVGDYYIPAIELPEDDDRPIGKWGRMHRAYLEETNPLLLNHLILTGKLYAYLLGIEDAAHNLMNSMMPRMAKEVGVTEQLKARDPMRWVGLINCCKAQIEEIILAELIYNERKDGTGNILVPPLKQDNSVRFLNAQPAPERGCSMGVWGLCHQQAN